MNGDEDVEDGWRLGKIVQRNVFLLNAAAAALAGTRWVLKDEQKKKNKK